MCTVTFIPQSLSGFILTSNRDEAPARKTLPPSVYQKNGVELVYPKDEVAGGTWFGISGRQRLICLLNGGFRAHEREEFYRMSRGVIVTEFLASENALAEINDYNFNGIEPFTVIIVEWDDTLRLYELVWDGSDSHFSERPLAPHIWSSSLLYSEEMKTKRNDWFSDFIFQNLNPTEAELLNFHKTAGDGNTDSDLIMDRGFVKTKSITQFTKGENACLRYEDLQTGLIKEQRI